MSRSGNQSVVKTAWFGRHRKAGREHAKKESHLHKHKTEAGNASTFLLHTYQYVYYTEKTWPEFCQCSKSVQMSFTRRHRHKGPPVMTRCPWSSVVFSSLDMVLVGGCLGTCRASCRAAFSLRCFRPSDVPHAVQSREFNILL